MTEKTIAESSRRGNEVREDEIDLLMLASHFLEHAKFIIVSLFIGAFLFGAVSMFLFIRSMNPRRSYISFPRPRVLLWI